MGLGIKTIRLDSSEVGVQGGMAVEIGQYTLSGADGNAMDTGKYLVVWRNEGGSWKLHRDIWNTSMPA
jgi:ketosteroid isomerase-like protein